MLGPQGEGRWGSFGFGLSWQEEGRERERTASLRPEDEYFPGEVARTMAGRGDRVRVKQNLPGRRAEHPTV